MSPALVLGQLRANLGRYLATVLAICVAVAFVVASGGLIRTLQASVLDVFSQRYVGSTAVVDNVGDRTSARNDEDRAQVAESERQALEAIAQTPGVAGFTVDREALLRVIPTDGSAQRYTTLTALAADEQLRWQELASGHFPDAPGQLLAPDGQGLAAGDTVDLRIAGNPDPQPATVVGTYHYVAQPDSTSDFPLFTTDEQIQQWVTGGVGGEVRVLGAPGTDAQQLVKDLRQSLKAVPDSDVLTVATAQAKTNELAKTFLGGLKLLNAAIYAFTVLAMAVAALVIATTFAVLMAGRVRELALLRTLGATRTQTRFMALSEAFIVAVVATALGLALGTWGVGFVASHSAQLGVTFPLDPQPVPKLSYLLGAFVGIVVTLVVALWPILRATSHSPLAALRPVDVRPHPWPLRIAMVLGGLLVAGVGFFLLTTFIAQRNPFLSAAAGVLMFLGLLLGLSALIPMLLGLIGVVLSAVPGALGLLGARNGARSPRRTASIAAALLIAVTLVSALVAGVTFLRPSLEERFVNRVPLDVAVSSPDGIFPDGLSAQLAEAPGVVQAVDVTTMPLSVPAEAMPSGKRTLPARVADPSQLSALMSRPITLPEPGQIVVPSSSPLAKYFFSGEAGPREVTLFDDQVLHLTPVESSDPWILINPADAPPWPVAQGPNGEPWPEGVEVPQEFIPRHETWLKLDPALPVEQREQDLAGIRELAAGARPDMTVSEAFRAREQLREAVQTVLTSTTLLLAVSVLIALIGVVNTYSLAVAERRRELALLRGVGVTRFGLRLMLLVEALLVAVLACGAGVVAGAFFGRAGAAAFLGEAAIGNISTPWGNVLLVGVIGVAVAVAAAGISSVRAAMVPPAGMELR